ncbi:retrovirus-related pol polyprotein from transposon TNT 1-94 [Tanacetum coccineum]
MDEHGVVVKNKARLVAQGSFLNGKISKEVYIQQPPGFESSEFLNHVCKLDKALYGMKQAPKAWYETLSKFLLQHKFVREQDFKGISICQEKYVKGLLKKYDLADSASVKCPMLPPNNLGPGELGVSVNETLYQANPKETHLVAIKRIFRYLKGTLNLVIPLEEFGRADAKLDADESPYDTEFEIKVVKKFQPPQTDDEDQITFLGPVYDEMNQLVEEPADSDLHSMPDDEVIVDNILDEMADIKDSTDKPSDPLGHLWAKMSFLSNKVDNLESSLAKKVSRKLEETVPSMVADAFEERMPELISDTIKNILPNIIEESIQHALLKFAQRI